MFNRERLIFIATGAAGWVVFVWARYWPINDAAMFLIRGLGLAGGVGALAVLFEDLLPTKRASQLEVRLKPAARQLQIYIPALIFYAWGINLLSRCWRFSRLLVRDTNGALLDVQSCDVQVTTSGAALMLVGVSLTLCALFRVWPFNKVR